MKKSNNLAVIGPKTLVSFKKQGILDVPAKIDTGADSSSVWASEIIEKNGTLSFVLFDPQSPWYNGKTIKTKRYTLRSIKNSFGVAEFRYKVFLNIEINNKKIKAQFTLSDRSNNRFPVLIGRHTLENRFLVDVSKDDHHDRKHILMISTKKTPATERFSQNIASHGKLDVTYVSYADLCYQTGLGGNKITLIDSGRDVASFDFIYFKTSARFQDIAASIARYAKNRRIPFIDTALLNYPATSKLYQYVILTDHKFSVPKSMLFFPERLAGSYEMIKDAVGLPFVLKDIHGNKGEHNYLVKDETSFKKACKKTKKAGVMCIAQGFVPNDCDYRVLVMGRKVRLVIKRNGTKKSHLNNTSKGATSELIGLKDLPMTVQKDSIAMAGLLDREVAGVDMVKDKMTNVWYCLEVNDGPQLASGSFVEEKHATVADYLYRKLR